MNSKTNTLKLTTTALLVAIAIIIPVIMPIKVIIGPASFTLASHVPIFLAMFLAPSISVIVALGATVGFFIAGFPIPVVLRALSHVIFVYLGSKILEKHQTEILNSVVKSQLYSFMIALVHALGEVIVVSLFYFGILGGMDTSEGFFYSVLLLVGVGTLVHSMVDFVVAQYLWQALENRFTRLKLKLNQE